MTEGATTAQIVSRLMGSRHDASVIRLPKVMEGRPRCSALENRFTLRAQMRSRVPTPAIMFQSSKRAENNGTVSSQNSPRSSRRHDDRGGPVSSAAMPRMKKLPEPIIPPIVMPVAPKKSHFRFETRLGVHWFGSRVASSTR